MKYFISPDLKVVKINKRDVIATSELSNFYSNNSMIYNGGWWGNGRAPERGGYWDGYYDW